MWQGERTLLYMLISVREMAKFPEFINYCLSFIYFHKLPPTPAVDAEALKTRGTGVAPAEGASPVPRRGSFHLSIGKIQLFFQLQGLFSTRCYTALADKPPLSGRNIWKSETLKTHRAQVFCTNRCLQEKKSLVSHLLFFKWELPRMFAFKLTKY